jgi:choline-sulfatase
VHRIADRPNILILMADQLAARALKAYGGRVARTPNIDVLAKEGVVFDSFYCNSPLCAPSRFSFMAGQLPSKIGAYDNAAEFPAQVPTFAHYLRAAGYQTALSGKMHFCGPDQLHGFEERLTTDIYPADFGWTPDWRRFEERPGWYHTLDSVTQAGPCTRTNQIDFDDEVVYAARQKLFDMARGKDRRPFFMVVSLTHPHDPYVISHEYWARYRDEEIDMPRVGDLKGHEDPHSTRLRHVIGLEQANPTAAQIRAARRAYYGSVSYVDDQVGQLVTTLQQAQLDQNTVIMLLADHGDMLGERGLWYKMNFYEPACRIPLIVHAPGRFSAHRVAGSASLLDVLPTIAALANNGSEPDYAAPIDGQSLVPALEGGMVRNAVIGEYLAEGAIAPVVMIRRGQFKFVHSPVDPDQLYDLSSDPDERINLAAADSGDVAAARVTEFREEVARRWNLSDINEAVLASQQRRHFVYSALRQGRYQPWDFQPRRDASRLYIRNDQELNDLESMARFPRLP